ncbi:glycosyltransferase family 32 protein [Roseateles sp.]|uniref:glycosyltransferase family 32 protein n=1 Tax=Roseateles sp. TaxID=1971397 RepID=UPI003BA707C1
MMEGAGIFMQNGLTVVAVLLVSTLAWELLQILRARAPRPENVHQQIMGCGPALAADTRIPKIIWSYWHSELTPEFVSLCRANWQRLNPGHEIRFLHRANFEPWLEGDQGGTEFEQLPPYRQADWLRLQLLARHGGIWLDATIVLTESLDWVHRLQQEHASEYLGFYLQGYSKQAELPMLENWFIAAVPGSPFIQAWATELEKALRLGEAPYLQDLKTAGRLERVAQNLPARMQQYLVMHMAAAAVLDESSDQYRLFVLRAEDSALCLHASLRWRKKHLYARLALSPCPARVPALVKIRGSDRRLLERGLAKKRYLRSSFVQRFLISAA